MNFTPQDDTKFAWNPNHPIGTCGRCGEEMVYNVPRMGAAGGFIHKDTGSYACGDSKTPPPTYTITFTNAKP